MRVLTGPKFGSILPLPVVPGRLLNPATPAQAFAGSAAGEPTTTPLEKAPGASPRHCAAWFRNRTFGLLLTVWNCPTMRDPTKRNSRTLFLVSSFWTPMLYDIV